MSAESTFHCDRGAILLPPKPEPTSEGFLRCFLRIGGTGDLSYRNLDGTERIEVVTPEVLFAKDSIDSFKMKPITYPHPPVKVRSDNVMQYGRGMLGHYAVIDGDFLGFVGTVTDKQAVDALLSGTATEASCGYDTATRQRGDGKFEQIRRDGNHVAIVPRGRAGSDVRFHVDGADEFEYWYQTDAPTDLYNADSETVREVFKDIQQRQLYDLGKRSSAQEQSVNTNADDMIAFPSGRVFNLEDEKLAGEVLDLIGQIGWLKDDNTHLHDELSRLVEAVREKDCECDDNPDEDAMELWKTLGYDSADAAVEGLNQKTTGLQAKLDAADGTATGLQSQVVELQTKLDAAEGNRMDADTIAAEVSNRADAWNAVLPLLRLDAPDFQPDYKLPVADVRKLAIAKKMPHLNLDGKSADYINAVWDTIAPGLKEVTRKDSSDNLLDLLNQAQRSDGGNPEMAMAVAKKKRADRIRANAQSSME
ncbi:MAG: DUF2213 domain-containing protein [Lyngbya sp. HA4199-MV5]|jgi:hypothetical protein|nr:DUF2213 domain-containing protein [Lyngbya sp. HA4199-MV5]